jgi:hypothetical protein
MGIEKRGDLSSEPWVLGYLSVQGEAHQQKSREVRNTREVGGEESVLKAKWRKWSRRRE